MHGHPIHAKHIEPQLRAVLSEIMGRTAKVASDKAQYRAANPTAGHTARYAVSCSVYSRTMGTRAQGQEQRYLGMLVPSYLKLASFPRRYGATVEARRKL